MDFTEEQLAVLTVEAARAEVVLTEAVVEAARAGAVRTEEEAEARVVEAPAVAALLQVGVAAAAIARIKTSADRQ